MINLDVRSALEGSAQAWLTTAEKNLRFATSLALTHTAQRAQAVLTKEITARFRDPVKMTREAVHIRGADRRLPIGEMRASVYLRDEASKGTPPSKYLAAEIEGGERRDKRSERALTRAGVIVPGQQTSAARNLRGQRLSGPTAVQMLSALKAFHEMGFVANRSAKTDAKRKKARLVTAASGADFFAAHKRGEEEPYAIFRLVAPGKVKPVLWVGRSAHYSARLPFWKIAEATARAAFPAEMRAALVAELATRR